MRLVGLVLSALVLVLAACGQADPPEERVAAAAERTAAADTARVTLESVTHMGGADGARMDVRVTGDGRIDFAAEQVHLTISMPGPLPGDMEMIADGDTVYLRMPFADVERWARLDAEATGAEHLLQPGAAGGPTDTLDALGAVRGEVTELGTEEVRDAAVDGYAFAVPADELFPADVGAEGLADVAVAMEAWLDVEGRVRRVSHTVDLGEVVGALGFGDVTEGLDPDSGADGMDPDISLDDLVGEQTTTVEFFAFGEPVTIEVPDEDQVEDRGFWEDDLLEDGGFDDGWDEAAGARDL